MKKVGIIVKVYKSMTRCEKSLKILDSYSFLEISNFWFDYVRCGVKPNNRKKMKFYSHKQDQDVE